MSLPTVKFDRAYRWICPECSFDNFGIVSMLVISPVKKEEIFRKAHDMDEWEELPDGWDTFQLYHVPDVVTCIECDRRFEMNGLNEEPEQ